MLGIVVKRSIDKNLKLKVVKGATKDGGNKFSPLSADGVGCLVGRESLSAPETHQEKWFGRHPERPPRS